MTYLPKRKISPPSHDKEISKRRNEKWNKYYGSTAWKKLRQWKITHFPICYDCMFNGISKPATQVHHIRPFSEGKTQEEKWELLLDPSNLVSLCDECHDKRHAILRHNKLNQT